MIGNHEIWDEFRWEHFMLEQDRKAERCMELLYRGRAGCVESQLSAWFRGMMEEWCPIPGWGEDEAEEGEAWKEAAGLEDEDLPGCSNALLPPAHRLAREFAFRAFRFVDALPEEAHMSSAVVDFVSNAMIAAWRVALGTAIGLDADELGGNIACCKRALAAANLSIVALREMKLQKIVGGNTWLDLAMEGVEVRDAIALHVADLREKFRREA
jgi:hypothetical protein